MLSPGSGIMRCNQLVFIGFEGLRVHGEMDQAFGVDTSVFLRFHLFFQVRVYRLGVYSFDCSGLSG